MMHFNFALHVALSLMEEIVLEVVAQVHEDHGVVGVPHASFRSKS